MILVFLIICRVVFFCYINICGCVVKLGWNFLFFVGYGMLVVIVFFIVLDVYYGYLFCGFIYVFLVVSDLLIFFKCGSEFCCEYLCKEDIVVWVYWMIDVINLGGRGGRYV